MLCNYKSERCVWHFFRLPRSCGQNFIVFATRAPIIFFFFFFFFQNIFPHSRNAQITPTQKHTTKMFSTAKTFTTSTASLRATSSKKVQSKKTFIVRNQILFFFFFFSSSFDGTKATQKETSSIFLMITLSLPSFCVADDGALCSLLFAFLWTR
jgi:hypothetical protein